MLGPYADYFVHKGIDCAQNNYSRPFAQISMGPDQQQHGHARDFTLYVGTYLASLGPAGTSIGSIIDFSFFALRNGL